MNLTFPDHLMFVLSVAFVVALVAACAGMAVGAAVEWRRRARRVPSALFDWEEIGL